MWTAIFPIWARIAIIVGALATIFGIGYVHGRDNEAEKKDLEIATLQHAFDTRIAAANDALVAANNRAAAATAGANTDQAAIVAAYSKGKTDGQVAAQARVDSYASGRQRVRVDAVCRPANAGGGSQLPGTSAVAGGANAAPAAGDAELSPDAAGRLAAAAEKVNALARQVVALQALAQSEHDRCNQASVQPPAAVPQPDPVKSRSRFKLGAPNPFDNK